MSRAQKAAIAAQIVLLMYFEVCILMPLGNWNYQPGNKAGFSAGNLAMAGAIGGAQLLLLVGTIWRLRILLWFGLIGDSVWLILHLQSLWVPYIAGASPKYAQMYERVFSHSTRLLPNFGSHLAPDAMHIFIDVFVVAVLATLVRFMRSLRGGQQPRISRAEIC